MVALWCEVWAMTRWEVPNWAVAQALERALCGLVMDFRDLEVIMGFHGWML